MPRINFLGGLLPSFLLTLILLQHNVALTKKTRAIERINYANQLVQEDKLTEAIKIYKNILKQNQHAEFLWYNLAYILRIKGNPEEAIPAYEQAIKLNPNNEDAYLGLAKSYLSVGRFLEGWKNFEYRYNNVEACRQEEIDPKQFRDKTIFLMSEWGLGDTIQFVRYAKLLKEYGAKEVWVETPKPLVPLFSLCDYIDGIIPKGQKRIPVFDYKIPILSMPMIFQTKLETIPAYSSYLNADSYLVNYWKEKLKNDTNFRVGLCWHAKPNFIEEHIHTKRSVRLDKFAPLAEINGVSFYSLQQIHGVDQIQNLPSGFFVKTFEDDFDKSHGRFMDTAAVIKNMDLILSVDTSIVHLAGAIGKDVWVLIPSSAEWRWLLKKEDTPWYFNMKLFRQTQPNDWETVIQKVKNELQILVSINKKR